MQNHISHVHIGILYAANILTKQNSFCKFAIHHQRAKLHAAEVLPHLTRSPREGARAKPNQSEEAKLYSVRNIQKSLSPTLHLNLISLNSLIPVNSKIFVSNKSQEKHNQSKK